MTLPAELEANVKSLVVSIQDLVTANVAYADLVEQLRADIFKIQGENVTLHTALGAAQLENTNLHAEIAALELTVPRLTVAAPAPAVDPLADVLEPPPVVPAPRPSRVPPLASEVKDEPKAPAKAAAPAPALAPAVTKNGRALVVKGSGNK